MHTLDPSHQEEEDSEDSDNPEAETLYDKKMLPKLVRLGCNPLHTGSVLQLTMKVKRITEATWDHYLQISPNASLYGSRFSMHGQEKSVENNQAIPWKIRMWILLSGNDSWCSSSSRNRLWHEFEMCKELSLENNRTVFQEDRKADQWSDRNHWHERDQFPRFKVVIDKLIAQSSFHCQSSRLLRLCALLGKKWATILLNPGRANSMALGHQLFQRLESNWWTACGIRVEDFSRFHHSGNPQWDSTDGGKLQWTRELHRQDHLHVNVQRHCVGC